MNKDHVAALTVVVILAWMILNLIPGAEKFDRYLVECPDSRPVIVNGEFVACTGDEASAANLWVPDGPPAELVRCRACEVDDGHLDVRSEEWSKSTVTD